MSSSIIYVGADVAKAKIDLHAQTLMDCIAEHIQFLDRQIASCDRLLRQLIAADEQRASQVATPVTISGIGHTSAIALLAAMRKLLIHANASLKPLAKTPQQIIKKHSCFTKRVAAESRCFSAKFLASFALKKEPVAENYI